jgi:hypothetical protein
MSAMGNRILSADEFFYPKNIGDDVCFKTKVSNGYVKIRLYFIRNYTVFEIGIFHLKNVDIIEEIAQYIDQKFFEINKQLNE